MHCRIQCADLPLGMGKEFKGVYNLYTGIIHVYHQGQGNQISKDTQVDGTDNSKVKKLLGEYCEDFIEEIELIKGASHKFNLDAYLGGELTPVYFGTALGNFGVREMLDLSLIHI